MGRNTKLVHHYLKNRGKRQQYCMLENVINFFFIIITILESESKQFFIYLLLFVFVLNFLLLSSYSWAEPCVSQGVQMNPLNSISLH